MRAVVRGAGYHAVTVDAEQVHGALGQPDDDPVVSLPAALAAVDIADAQ